MWCWSKCVYWYSRALSKFSSQIKHRVIHKRSTRLILHLLLAFAKARRLHGAAFNIDFIQKCKIQTCAPHKTTKAYCLHYTSVLTLTSFYTLRSLNVLYSCVQQTVKPSWMATWSWSWVWCGPSFSTTPSPCPCGRMRTTVKPKNRRPSRGCWAGSRTKCPTFPSLTSVRTGATAGLWGLWWTAALQVSFWSVWKCAKCFICADVVHGQLGFWVCLSRDAELSRKQLDKCFCSVSLFLIQRSGLVQCFHL